MTERIEIYDTTLRDGEQSPGCSMNLEEKLRMAEILEGMGVDVRKLPVEIGIFGAEPWSDAMRHDLEARLDPNAFVRIHRSAIVNLDRVKEMRPLFRGELVVVLHDGTQLRMSRGRREDLESRFRRR